MLEEKIKSILNYSDLNVEKNTTIDINQEEKSKIYKQNYVNLHRNV